MIFGVFFPLRNCPFLLPHPPRYQIMQNCWEEEPSNRPSFTQLKEEVKQLQENNRNSHFIRFPGPEIINGFESDSYLTASPVRGNSPTPQEQPPSLGDSNPTSPEGAQRLRRHLSAPAREGADRNGGGGGGGDESSQDASIRRSHSNANPYVRTPRRDSDHQIKTSFEWLLEPPIITNPPVITIQTENGDEPID